MRMKSKIKVYFFNHETEEQATNSTTGWGEARGISEVSLTAEMCSGRCHKQTRAQQGRSQEELIPSPLPTVPNGPASSACQTRNWGLTENTHLCAGSCPCLAAYRCCSWAGELCTEQGWQRSPAGPSTQASNGCSFMDGGDATVPNPANPELFWHVKEWCCWSKFIEKWDETLLLFLMGSAPDLKPHQ